MRRRALLAALAAGASTAGCLGDDDQSDDPSDAETTRTATTVASGSTATPTADPTATPETTTDADRRTTAVGDPPEEVGVAPADSDCPAPDDADRVVCHGEVDPELSPIALSPSTASGSLPSATFKFALRNRSEARFDINFYAWRVLKRVDGEWFHVAPRGWPEPLHTMPPGESHAWSVTLERALADPGTALCCSGGGTDGGTLGGFGGGEYAFLTDGWFASDSERRIALVAQFDLAGDPLELDPVNVAESTRDADVVTVRAADDREDGEMATFQLARTDADPDRRMIPEQAVRDYRFRNTLPFLEDDVREVRFRRKEGSIPPFGVDEPFVVAYEGERFEVSAGTGSDSGSAGTTTSGGERTDSTGVDDGSA